MGIIESSKCKLVGHEMQYVRAEAAPDEMTGTRQYRDGKEEEEIDICYLIDKCARCGVEERVRSPISAAQRRGFSVNST